MSCRGGRGREGEELEGAPDCLARRSYQFWRAVGASVLSQYQVM